MATKFVSYLRVSTAKQGLSGLGLEAQQQSVHDYLTYQQGELVAQFVEVESGKKSNRPQLLEALRACKRAGATLLIAKLDRLARNVAFIANLMEAGTDFVAADNPHASKAMLQMMAVFAEMERDQISQRTKDALKAAKKRGIVLGGRRTQDQYEQAKYAIINEANLFATNVRPVITQIQATGVSSYSDIANCLNARGIQTRRGGEWHASTVRNIVLRQI